MDAPRQGGDGLPERLVMKQTQIMHSIQDPSVYRLKAVLDVREGSAHYD